MGRGAALALADRGFDLVLIDLLVDETAAETAAAIEAKGAKVKLLQGDIADLAAHEGLSRAAWDAFGGIECMVNNAGVAPLQRGSVLTLTPEAYDHTMNVNLRGKLFFAQAVARLMVEDTDNPYYRSMFFLASMAAEKVSVGMPEYSISKAAISMTSRAFALTLAEYGIQVHEIRPGFIRTEMTQGGGGVQAQSIERRIAAGEVPMRRWGEEEDVGRTIATLASGDLPFTTAHPIYVDGGYTAPKT